MNKAQVLSLLNQHRTEILQRFSVKHLAVFGSAARDEMRTGSDVDVLVEFDGASSFARYFELKDYLERLFGRRVDLVTEKGLKPRARRHVEEDLIRVA
ncbi:MAG: nucleotidyltransferase family protein [Pseudomonadota bacterium]